MGKAWGEAWGRPGCGLSLSEPPVGAMHSQQSSESDLFQQIGPGHTGARVPLTLCHPLSPSPHPAQEASEAALAETGPGPQQPTQQACVWCIPKWGVGERGSACLPKTTRAPGPLCCTHRTHRGKGGAQRPQPAHHSGLGLSLRPQDPDPQDQLKKRGLRQDAHCRAWQSPPDEAAPGCRGQGLTGGACSGQGLLSDHRALGGAWG